jgi:hypothetical protein
MVNETCSVCNCEFDIEGEGGVKGEIGILPIALCPTCYSGMCDMTEQLEPNAHIDCPECGHGLKLRVNIVDD